MRAAGWLLVSAVVAAVVVRAQEEDEDDLLPLEGYDTRYRVLKAGPPDAPAVEKGDTVTVHATGIVQDTGKKFWSTKDKGQSPFTYKAGVGGVIKGWDQGCLGMKKEEIRSILIPAHEGYGQEGFPAWGIPKGGTLKFEIEVLNIKKF